MPFRPCLARKPRAPDDAVIDESQDLDLQRLALIRLLAGKGRDSLTLLGDMNQRIYGDAVAVAGVEPGEPVAGDT